MSRLFFTPLAEADLASILDSIAQDRPRTATAVVARIRKRCELLASHPLLGQRRPEFPGEYRCWPAERWVIFYRVVGDSVEIHRVVDGAMDIDTLLGEQRT